MRTILILAALGLCWHHSAHATRYHVNGAATGAGTGLTWSNAFTDLQEALSIVIPGDEIWVAAGQYRPTSGTNRTVSFVLRNGVDIYGGFAGTETLLEQRDILNNPTTLNGNIGELGLATDNSHSVVTANNISTSIVLDGFRIMNGYNTNGSHGGGMRVTNSLTGEVLVRNCRFLSHYSANYGGAIYLAAANLRMENCEFLNSSSSNGGAIHNGNNNGGYSNLVLRDCVFKGNTANSGACLDNTIRYETIVVDRCFFTNNTSANSVIVIDDFLSAKLMNSAIIGNTVNGFSSRVLRVNTFGSSTAPFDMINCTIAHNRNVTTSTLQGEMVRLEDNHLRVTNCILFGNTPYAGRQLNNGPIVRYSLVQGGHLNGTAILDTDPEFVAPNASTQGAFDATAFDYTLLASSPCINVGDNDAVDADAPYDLALNDRIRGGVVDLGCYESELSVSTGTSTHATRDWFFDMERNELRVTDLGPQQLAVVEVFDMSGKLRERFTAVQNSVQVDLPAGAYVARSAGRAPLKFVVLGR
jgi:hypothetical protein